ncbi:MAG: hypothetical protein ACTHQ3_18700 [Motilibacteraceae bacterium]
MAQAAGDQTTPGVTIKAQNPGTSAYGSDLRITLTAHSEASTVTSPSCRPQDANILCWGDLVLRLPDFGGLTLKGLQVHRVAIRDTSCGGGGGGGGGGGDDCGDMTATMASGHEPQQVPVNGLSTMTVAGDSGLRANTQVQVKITMTDYGRAQYRDTVDLQINEFVPGMLKPLIYDSGSRVVQQVDVHVGG